MGRDGEEREEVGVSQRREGCEREGLGDPHMKKEIKQGTECPLVSASEWDFPLPG